MERSKRNNRSVDRLSSLPNDILIVIISRLPLQSAIATETLSRRWHGLWSNTTSIDITLRDTYNVRNVDTPLNNLNCTMRQITSPFIHSFNIEFLQPLQLDFWAPCLDIIMRDVCNRNVHQLKVTWCIASCWDIICTLPSVIFQTQSLESLELGSTYCGGWRFPEDCDTINLPNLKNLSIHFCSQLEWIEKLVKACPSLEELSLNCWARKLYESSSRTLKCWNQKLRKLFINFSLMESCTIVVNAPNLESLDIYVPRNMTFSFDEEPIMLRETKIEFNGVSYNYCITRSDKDNLSKFYEAISNVRFLTLDISAVKALSTVFRNVTRLTFDMKLRHNLNTQLSLSVLEMCPVVDVLDLKIWGVDSGQLFYRKIGKVRTSPQALRRIKLINVEIDNWRICWKSFSRLIVHLLRSGRNLERFNLSVNDFQQDWLPRDKLLHNQEHELKLCKKLYLWPTISTCDVEFKGRFLKMSRKDGPKVTTVDGKVIYFHRSRKGFINKEK